LRAASRRAAADPPERLLAEVRPLVRPEDVLALLRWPEELDPERVDEGRLREEDDPLPEERLFDPPAPRLDDPEEPPLFR